MYLLRLNKFIQIKGTSKFFLWLLMAVIGCHDTTLAQVTFNASSGLPIDLDNGTNYVNCGAPGTKAITFQVECIGNLNISDKQLAEINFRLDASCGGNLQNVGVYIKSPSGTCALIAASLGGTTNYTLTPVNRIDFTFRNVSLCLNKAPDYTAFPTTVVAASNQSGRYGIFSTAVDIRNIFAGENADGVWTLYFTESASAAPCVTSASITFGNPTNADRRTQGENCVTAVNWNGEPICVSTNGKNASANSPAWNGSSFTGACRWNNSNDNDVWVSFTPTSADACISISGLSAELQSIVVTDPNTDGDNNPCTGAGNGGYWTVVSCPRDRIYTTEIGTMRNHNHCFTAVPGQRYYLVVDGNAGAISDFYINGTTGFTNPNDIVCPVNQTVCQSDPAFNLTGANPPGGIFSGSGVTGAVFNPAAAGVGTHVIQYEVIQFCDTLRCSFQITVNPSTIPVFNPVPAICQGDPAPVLPTTSVNGISGTWNPATVSNTATGTYTFTPNSGQCASTTSLTITVNGGGAPVFNWNSYPAGSVGNNVYTNTQGTCTMTASVSGTEFVNLANGTTPPLSPFYTTAVGTGLHLRHNWSSTSPNPVTTLTMNFNPPINNPSFTLFDINRNNLPAICSNLWTDRVIVSGFSGATPVLATINQANVADQTISTVGNSRVIVGNQGSFADVFVSFAGPISQIVIVYTSEATISSTNGCPGGSSNPTTQFITVGNVSGTPVTAPTAITGNNTICAGASTTLTVSGGNSNTQWFSGACGGVLVGTGTSITVSPVSTTTYFASNNNCGCNTACVSITVQVNPSITPVFSPLIPVCSGAAVPALPTISNNGISGTWNPPIISNTNSGVYTFTPDSGLCATGGTTLNQTILPNPNTSPIFHD
jgi:hypothetical protein